MFGAVADDGDLEDFLAGVAGGGFHGDGAEHGLAAGLPRQVFPAEDPGLLRQSGAESHGCLLLGVVTGKPAVTSMAVADQSAVGAGGFTGPSSGACR